MIPEFGHDILISRVAFDLVSQITKNTSSPELINEVLKNQTIIDYCFLKLVDPVVLITNYRDPYSPSLINVKKHNESSEYEE